MSDWLAACPECGTHFRVQEGQLVVADGLVRCGACLAVFQAYDHLELVDGDAEVIALAPPPPEQPERHQPVLERDEEPVEASSAWFEQAPDELTPESVPEPPAEALAPTPPVLPAPRPRVRNRLLWSGVLAFGVLLALGQLAYWTFPDAAMDPRLRATYARICDVMGCALPQHRDVSAIRSRRLLVRPHPAYANALLFEATIENVAPFAQPFPIIELQFADIRGDPVAARRVPPERYLAGEVRPGAAMPPNREVLVAMEIESPGEHAVNYQIRFW